MAKKKLAPSPDYSQPYSLRVTLEKFEEWLAVRNYSPNTIVMRHDDILRFINWSQERALEDVREIGVAEIERYQRWLSNYRRADNGRALHVESQLRCLTSLRVFFRWLNKRGYIQSNPALDMELPKLGKRLPKGILTVAEVEEVLKQPNLQEDKGIRDRAMLETLYSTGIRRAELMALKLKDLDIDRGMLAVIGGKGAKDRIIPIGERAMVWIEKYLREVRCRVAQVGEEALFVTKQGTALSLIAVGAIVKRYLQQAEIYKSGSCHLFRHTMATLMLEGGADIRYIQEMLGHEGLSTTQIYTRVFDRKLKQVHTASHPGAQLHPKRKKEVEE